MPLLADLEDTQEEKHNLLPQTFRANQARRVMNALAYLMLLQAHLPMITRPNPCFRRNSFFETLCTVPCMYYLLYTV